MDKEKMDKILDTKFTKNDKELLRKLNVDDDELLLTISKDIGCNPDAKRIEDFNAEDINKLHTAYVDLTKKITNVNSKLFSFESLQRETSSMLQNLKMYKDILYRRRQEWKEMDPTRGSNRNILIRYKALSLPDEEKAKIIKAHWTIKKNEKILKETEIASRFLQKIKKNIILSKSIKNYKDLT